MKRSLSVLALPLVLFGSVLFAQDAGMVLRTSVSYNTQKATLTLTDEQRKQADELSRQAQLANQAGKYGDAMRNLYQGLAVIRKVLMTPGFDVATAPHGQPHHPVRRPGAAGSG